MKREYTFDDFMEIIRTLRSPNGCPWDREQTHESLKTCTIEETYEVIDAIENKDYKNLCEELGDMLLQVALHTAIAEEYEEFTIEDVIKGISDKMILRHPHVFSGVKVSSSSEVLANWDEIKKKEKNRKELQDSLSSVPKALPALIRAQKVQKEAGKYGLDYNKLPELTKNIEDGLKNLTNTASNGSSDELSDKYGEILFQIVNLSRFFELNAENSLTNATNKFINRFVSVEHLARLNGKCLNDLSIEELRALWGRVK